MKGRTFVTCAKMAVGTFSLQITTMTVSVYWHQMGIMREMYSPHLMQQSFINTKRHISFGGINMNTITVIYKCENTDIFLSINSNRNILSLWFRYKVYINSYIPVHNNVGFVQFVSGWQDMPLLTIIILFLQNVPILFVLKRYFKAL
jgi:hypothetical protein